MPDERLRATERWFYRRGLPFFVEDYRSSTAVWTRASPALAVLFIIMTLGAAFTFDDVIGAVAGLVMAVVVGAVYAAWNRSRGRSWRAPAGTGDVAGARGIRPGARHRHVHREP